MEIKFNNMPVCIKTITVDSKKLTKQMVEQIPLDYYVYHKDDDGYGCYGVTKHDDGTLYEYFLNGTIIGFISIKTANKYGINQWARQTNEKVKDYSGEFLDILFIDEEGILKRTYLDDLSQSVIKEKIEQIYI